MSTPLWFVKLLKNIFPQRFLFAKMAKWPILGDIIDFSLFQDDYILYLPSDKNIKIFEDIEETQDLVLPSRIVEHFIEFASYHWIMDFCICREGDGCTEYPKDLGCLFLGKPVLGINQNLVIWSQRMKPKLICFDVGKRD